MSEMISRRSGWLTFAGIVLVGAGLYNAIAGIAAIGDDDTLKGQATEVLYGIDLSTWGWFWLIVGILQIIAGVLIFGRNTWGLYLGVLFASISAVMTVFVMFTFPLWAIAVLTLDFLVLYGLLTRSDEFES
jgi:hypothetical protein